jgi:hypothetical protein
VPISTLGEGTYTLVALGESVQADRSLLTECARAGLIPGATITVTAERDSWLIAGTNGEVALDGHDAAHVFAEA